jgi:hypothetical protein
MELFELVVWELIRWRRHNNLANGNKENDGLRSLLYLWSGTSTYSFLAAEIYTCSVETDCDDTISVISLDFRYF